MLENQKIGGSKELFLPEDDFQNSSTENLSKKHASFGGLDIYNGGSKTQKRIVGRIFLHF